MGADPRNPLHRAGFYVEALKYGVGPRQLEGGSGEQVAAQLEVLLRDAGVDTMTGAEVWETLRFYGASCARSFHVHPVIALSLFVDGFMHGVALAGRLEGPDPLTSARAQDAAAGSPQCDRCGCTENFACPNGCGWSSLDPPVCTACAAAGDTTTTEGTTT